MTLSWDLVSPAAYQAGQELGFNVSFTAPEEGHILPRKYYLAGALYTTALAYIPGTIFSIFQAPGTDYGTPSTQYCSVWELEDGESVDLPCRLTLDRSNVVLGLFLFRMAGDTPSFGVDEEIGSVSAELVSPTPTPIPTPTWSLESIMALIMVGMVGYAGYKVLKE